MPQILQIVPSLPPETGGVGDYALALAKVLAGSYGLTSSFLVGKPSWQGGHEVDAFSADRTPARVGGELARKLHDLDASTVILQLSGYGYDPNGCPSWLADGLQEWKQKFGGRLLTMVHETYASGPPWKKAFWLSGRQRSIVSQLAKLSDVVFTNIDRYRGQLEHFDRRKKGKVQALPVFSNVGELMVAPPLEQRSKRLVVFGGALTRHRAYTEGSGELLSVCDALGVERIVDVGPSLPAVPRTLHGRSVESVGVLSSPEVSALMRDTVAGYVNYFPGYEAKSSVFAAYCAHGMLPVTPDPNGSPADSLLPGVHYWCAKVSGLSWDKAQSIADAAFKWYTAHNLAAHGAAFAAVVGGTSDVLAPQSTNPGSVHHRKTREVSA